MAEVEKFSSQMDAAVLAELRKHAKESDRRFASVLTEAAREYLLRSRLRPAVIEAAERLFDENEELLKRLAK